MFHKYTLQPAAWHQKPLVFEWNAATGEVRGADADKLLGIVASAVNEGGMTGHPHPTSYDILDPLHRPSEMAVILGQYWILPDDLAAAYPIPVIDDEEFFVIDENGVKHDISGMELH
ncbi:MAG: hypothetical protein PHP85_02835 [Gallionella sp.]|nr:hypothetical protein [Gallionella sp.]